MIPAIPLFQRIGTFIAALAVLAAISSCSKGVDDEIEITRENKYITADDIQAGIIKTSRSMSASVFSHSMHKSAGVSCETCHHKSNNDERIKRCVYCHKGIQGTRTFHRLCVGCHTAKKDGPAECAGCHRVKKESEMRKSLSARFNMSGVYGDSFHPSHNNAGIACATCHHKDSDGNYRKCSVCHKGDSRMRVLHYFCRDCHKQSDRGPKKCEGCHKSFTGLKVADHITLPDTGHRKAPIRFSHKAHIEDYNTECTDCHHKGSEYKCSACHLLRDQGNIVNLKEAFHQQCQDCHRKTSGPRACRGCHR